MEQAARLKPLWQAPAPSWFPGEFHRVVGCTHAGATRIRTSIGANMSVPADGLGRTGGFAPDLGCRKLGLSVSGRARIGGKAESCKETESFIWAPAYCDMESLRDGLV
ncbi:hypothetical protein NKI01_27640 [Mesorhizobium sp. M0815]|uniref:hypothetical protein n=1 Tax=unclassified Mesorhizobium TaxID=325217 RepID=UPI003339E6DB